MEECPVAKRVKENGAVKMKMLTKSYLCGSVPVQKQLPKLSARCRGERSQCRPAMADSEEAGQFHSEGWHNGLNDVRAPAPTAKHVSLLPQSLSWKSKRLSSTTIRVIGVISWRKRYLFHTGEVPHRSGPPAWITQVYKATPKSPVHAVEQRRLSQQPLPWGCQQSQSNGAGATRAAKGKTDRKQVAASVLMGTVSQPAPGHQMAGSSLFRSTRLTAKKHPPTARSAALAVRKR